jgi:hypothetical protein
MGWICSGDQFIPEQRINFVIFTFSLHEWHAYTAHDQERKEYSLLHKAQPANTTKTYIQHKQRYPAGTVQ